MEAVKNGIIRILADIDPDINVYDERLEQGFTEPCFFVLEVDGSQQKGIGRYRRSLMYDIHYFPVSDFEKRNECEAMANRLYSDLEYIRWQNDVFNPLNHRHQIVDDVLHFFIDVNVHLVKEKVPGVKMNTMEGQVLSYGRTEG